MRYELLQAYQGHTEILEGQCPSWICRAVTDGEADAFLLKKKEMTGDSAVGCLAIQAREEGAELLYVHASEEKSFPVLFRRLRQYLKERELSSVSCHEMVPEERVEGWERLLGSQHFVLEEAEHFYEIPLEDIEKTSVFAENEKVTNAVEKGRIRPALGAVGSERKALLELMERTHPGRNGESPYGEAFPELSGIYVHNHKVLGYLFLSVYKGCVIVEECGAEKGMEAILLALMNHFIPEIRQSLPDAACFYVPVDGDLMSYPVCKKQLLRKELQAKKSSLCHASWDQDQAFAMREVQELLLPESEDEEAMPEETAIIVQRLMQLEGTLDEMQQECLLVPRKDEPALQLWMDVNGVEVICYLQYSIWNLDEGGFVLEAVVSLDRVYEDEREAEALCADYNRKSLLSTLYPEEGRYFLRLTHKEQGEPANEDVLRVLLEDIVGEWELFQAVTMDD